MIYFFISFFFSRDHLFHSQCAQTTLKKNPRKKERKKAAKKESTGTLYEPKSSLRTVMWRILFLSSVTPSCSASLLLCFLIKLFACQLFSGTDPQPCEKLIPVCLRAGSISLGTPSLGQTQGRPWQGWSGRPGPDQPLEAGPLSTTSALFHPFRELSMGQPDRQWDFGFTSSSANQVERWQWRKIDLLMYPLHHSFHPILP